MASYSKNFRVRLRICTIIGCTVSWRNLITRIRTRIFSYNLDWRLVSVKKCLLVHCSIIGPTLRFGKNFVAELTTDWFLEKLTLKNWVKMSALQKVFCNPLRERLSLYSYWCPFLILKTLVSTFLVGLPHCKYISTYVHASLNPDIFVN